MQAPAQLPEVVVVPAGTVGFIVNPKSKAKLSPKARVNATYCARVLGSEVIGCGEYAKLHYIVRVQDHTLSINADSVSPLNA